MTLGFAPETIELWPIERLRPYAQNAKTHGADQVARIAARIAEFGWTVPVLVGEDGEVIAGISPVPLRDIFVRPGGLADWANRESSP